MIVEIWRTGEFARGRITSNRINCGAVGRSYNGFSFAGLETVDVTNHSPVE